MTREEAKELFRSDKDSYGKPRAIMSKIDKIYDSFNKESKIKDKDLFGNDIIVLTVGECQEVYDKYGINSGEHNKETSLLCGIIKKLEETVNTVKLEV